ncbi:hypothetical protein BGW80DRAFT_1248639 [Lactifluus volemus]|nr:hypothetical protein BGW80DRAFT_1248639 [Lactifluus volemus]
MSSARLRNADERPTEMDLQTRYSRWSFLSSVVSSPNDSGDQQSGRCAPIQEFFAREIRSLAVASLLFPGRSSWRLWQVLLELSRNLSSPKASSSAVTRASHQNIHKIPEGRCVTPPHRRRSHGHPANFCRQSPSPHLVASCRPPTTAMLLRDAIHVADTCAVEVSSLTPELDDVCVGFSVRAEVNSKRKRDVRAGRKERGHATKAGLFQKISMRGRLDIPTSPRMSAAAAPMMHSSVKVRGLLVLAVAALVALTFKLVEGGGSGSSRLSPAMKRRMGGENTDLVTITYPASVV